MIIYLPLKKQRPWPATSNLNPGCFRSTSGTSSKSQVSKRGLTAGVEPRMSMGAWQPEKNTTDFWSLLEHMFNTCQYQGWSFTQFIQPWTLSTFSFADFCKFHFPTSLLSWSGFHPRPDIPPAPTRSKALPQSSMWGPTRTKGTQQWHAMTSQQDTQINWLTTP